MKGTSESRGLTSDPQGSVSLRAWTGIDWAAFAGVAMRGKILGLVAVTIGLFATPTTFTRVSGAGSRVSE